MYTFLLLVFATFRLAELVSVDDGPSDVFKRIRVRCGAYDRDENGEIATSLGKFIACPYCQGLWIALVLILLTHVYSRDLFGVTMFVIDWFAVAGAQAALQTQFGRT